MYSLFRTIMLYSFIAKIGLCNSRSIGTTVLKVNNIGPRYYAVYNYFLFSNVILSCFVSDQHMTWNMGKSVSLSPNERRVINQKLGDGHIAELLKWDIRFFMLKYFKGLMSIFMFSNGFFCIQSILDNPLLHPNIVLWAFRS